MKHFFFFLILLFGAPAFAQDVHDACRADANRLCPGVQAGGGRIFNCLAEKEDSLSVTCKAGMGMMGGRNPALQSCIPEIEHYCQGTRGAKALSCLQAHHDKLTDLCRRAMAQTPAAE